MQDIRRKTVAAILAGGAASAGEIVDVKGWVRTRRGNKNVQFVALNDGSTINNLQIVFDLSKFSDDSLSQSPPVRAYTCRDGLWLLREQGKAWRFRPTNLRSMAQPR